MNLLLSHSLGRPIRRLAQSESGRRGGVSIPVTIPPPGLYKGSPLPTESLPLPSSWHACPFSKTRLEVALVYVTRTAYHPSHVRKDAGCSRAPFALRTVRGWVGAGWVGGFMCLTV